MNPRRVRALKAGDLKKGPIVYWMSRDQRTKDNWALLFSQELSQQEKVPLLTLDKKMYVAAKAKSNVKML